MEKLTTEVALNVLIDWLQDNIDCGNMIIFDNDEDNTDSAVLLSWDFKSNSPCKFGKKIIVTGLVKCDRWGFGLNWGWQRDRLADLERMLILLDGKPVPDNRADVTRRLSDHIHENRHSNRYEDEMLVIKYFQKGTAHIVFKRPELVDKLNDIIARHYPGALPAR